VLFAVADDGLEGDADADLVEFFGQVEGVGVLAKGGEELGADGDDFTVHGRSFSNDYGRICLGKAGPSLRYG
jgi:hypothetical protein